jgi:hypothetical protein
MRKRQQEMFCNSIWLQRLLQQMAMHNSNGGGFNNTTKQP